MKRFVYVLMPVFVLALTATAFAQGGGKPVTTSDQNGETVKVTVSGGIDVDFVYRDGELREEGYATTFGADNEDVSSIEGTVRVRLDIELTNKVSAVVELANYRVNGGAVTSFWGDNGEDLDVFFSEANIKLSDVLQQGLNLTAGVVPWSWNIRGKGGSLVFDPRHSAGVETTLTVAGSNIPTGRDELQPAGLLASYNRDAITLDIALLPAIDEGGKAGGDEAAYALGLYYKLANFKEGSRIGILAALMADAGPEFNVYTVGAGANIIGIGSMETLEIFAEVYFNFGDAGQTGTTTIDAKGFAFQVGVQYGFAGEQKPWVGAKLTWFSGDDNSVSGADEEENFISYESIDDLLVLEDQYFGLNVRSNYMAIKVSGGASLSVGGTPNNLDLGLVVGFARLDEDVTFAGGDEDDLGLEFDVNVRYNISKQTALDIRIGYLTGSDVLENLTAETEDKTYVGSLGFDVRF